MPSGARLVSTASWSEPKFVRRSFVEMMFCNLGLWWLTIWRARKPSKSNSKSPKEGTFVAARSIG
jgi:hypothetical protein